MKGDKIMSKASSKTELSEWANNNVLAIAIAVVVLVIIMMFFWDRQQQRTVELRRIESRVDILEEWGMPPQQQNAPQDNMNAQGDGGRIF